MKSPFPPPMRRRALAVAAATVFASGVVFAESATVLKTTEVRATPATTGEVAGKLKAKDTVEVTARQGAWMNVTAGDVSGWARSLNFRGLAASGGRSGGADLGAPDDGELAELDGFASNSGDAAGFAGQAPVQAQQVAYLPQGRSGRRSR